MAEEAAAALVDLLAVGVVPLVALAAGVAQLVALAVAAVPLVALAALAAGEALEA